MGEFLKVQSVVLLVAVLLGYSSGSCSQSPWSAGPVGILQASPYIGGESGFLFVPAIAYEGEKLKVRGPFVDYYVYDEGRQGLSMALTFALGANDLEVDNDPILNGINDRDSGFLAGVRIESPLFNGTGSLAVQTDIADKSGGQRAIIAWSKPLFDSNPRDWILSAGVEVVWESADYANYYYGVTNEEAMLSVYSEYEPGSIISPALTLGGYYNFTQHWRFVYNLEMQILNSDVKDSPLVDQNTVTSGVIGLVYNF